jgi:DNA-binding winged helix-turn-helix (wHTH) protein
MRFNIDEFITFDSEQASLVNLLTDDCIELSATSARLFSTLLQSRGDIISRVDIFQSVFEQYGARPSNSNLNQYISTLRRSLADLGIEKEVIITVPRIGFKISTQVIITCDNSDDSPSFALPHCRQHRPAIVCCGNTAKSPFYLSSSPSVYCRLHRFSFPKTRIHRGFHSG